ncbi:MAG TPA: Stk1 family PASTA domain-containing Ser/Thr kinase, partial [Actinopolymorphaceae bacterium]|nr:Stk1 family PASTA domain-containing Ser/Thr kinase [Actinopolymorphaceae bacterium]
MTMPRGHQTEFEPPSSADDVAPAGHLLRGRYEVGEVIGHGGMAEVRIGVDQRLGRTVAVKTLRADMATDPTFQARFRREAQSAASLNHPSIVAVYDTGEEMVDGVSVPYIVMEYVEGRTLRDVLREGRRILPERALEIAADVLDALEYSHRAGIIHRDIKPANVMLTPNGDVKVMDFGIARAVADTSATMTQTAAVIGTAQYLSPEQARGESVDARSDIYSTGCLLYELLTGRPPFVGDSPVSVAYQHVREEPRPPSMLDPEVSPVADAITLQALQKMPHDRYQSAGEMREDIERGLSGQRIHASVVPADATARFLPADAPPPPHRPTQQWGRHSDDEPPEERSRKTAYTLLVLAILLVLGVAAFMAYQAFGGGNNPERLVTPTLIGKTEAQARSLLAQKGLELGTVNHEADETVPEGTISKQDPTPGEGVDAKTRINITISSGKPEVAVPGGLVGSQLDEAEALLRAKGFKVTEREDNRSTEDTNTVTRVDPKEGTKVAEESTVTLYYSTGLVSVPKVVGEEQSVADTKIREAGLKVTVKPSSSADAQPGTVVDQVPDPGTRRKRGSTVTIFVAQQQIAVPGGLVGSQVAQAKAILEADGFKVTLKK